MEYSINDFARFNYENFSPEVRKRDYYAYLGLAIFIVSGVAIYYYTENRKHIIEVTRLSDLIIDIKPQSSLQ